MKQIVFVILMVSLAVWAWAEPTVDGKIASGEYSHEKSVIDSQSKLYWESDGHGGAYFALKVSGHGWAGLGLGSRRMNGAYIYLGFIDQDGKPVFSEQEGQGHRHHPSNKTTADHWAVADDGSGTTLEFHVAADQLPSKASPLPFICAFANAKNMTSFHEDNFDSGTLRL